MPTVRCTGCDTQLNVPASVTDYTAECPICLSRFVVPSTGPIPQPKPASSEDYEIIDNEADDQDVRPSRRARPVTAPQSGPGLMEVVSWLLVTVLLSAIAPACVALLDGEPFVSILVPILMMYAAMFWLIGIAFRESVVCGLLILFVPFYLIYYPITRFQRCKRPLMLYISSFLSIVVTAFGIAVFNPDMDDKPDRPAPNKVRRK